MEPDLYPVSYLHQYRTNKTLFIFLPMLRRQIVGPISLTSPLVDAVNAVYMSNENNYCIVLDNVVNAELSGRIIAETKADVVTAVRSGIADDITARPRLHRPYVANSVRMEAHMPAAVVDIINNSKLFEGLHAKDRRAPNSSLQAQNSVIALFHWHSNTSLQNAMKEFENMSAEDLTFLRGHIDRYLEDLSKQGAI